MVDARLEGQKDALIRRLTEVYAKDGMDMPSFERAVTRISACADQPALVQEAASLGIAPSSPPLAPLSEVVELDCVSGGLRKEGDWVAAGRYRLRLQSSSARLDLCAYEDARGFRLEIELDARSSSLRLIVPSGFEVEDRFSERISSSVSNRPKGEASGDNRVLLTGAIRSSGVKVKYRH